jgi:hypothetical protein
MSTVTTHDSTPLDLRRAPERAGVDAGDISLLWFGILGPPILMLLNLELSYAITPWVCKTGDHFLAHATTGVLLLGVVFAALAPARRLRHDWLEDTVISRPGFMAMLGVLESALFAAVILAQWLPSLYLSTCQ